MIIARGHSVALTLADGRTIYGPRGSEILHDETGKQIPKDVALVMRFEHTGRKLEGKLPKHVGAHFGDYQPHDGRAELPPLTRGWTEVGQVSKIEYTRRGELHHGQQRREKTHDFGEGGFLFGSKMPTLYRRGEALMIRPVRWSWKGVH
ncbi:MAG: hypothetical protein ACYDDA_04765 [Acidiferrobacteraceae bacterium]